MELKDALSELNQTQIIGELNENKIEWVFDTPRGPWMGVAMEVLVKITKKCLKTIAKDRLLNEEMLSTYLVEVESIINSQHSTSINHNINDPQYLT